MSERGLEGKQVAKRAYEEGNGLEALYLLVDALVNAEDEVRRSHAEAAELRERVERLQDMVGRAEDCAASWMDECHKADKRVGELRKLENQLAVLTTYAATENGRQVARDVLDTLHAALSPANAPAKLESEEGEG